MSNYVREYTFIIPPPTFPGNSYYTNARDETRKVITDIVALNDQLVRQKKILTGDLGIDWYEIPLDTGETEYRVSLFSTARAVTPEILKDIHHLGVDLEFPVLIRTTDVQDLFCSGRPELATYFMNTYMAVGNSSFTSADVGAKNAYAKQNCKPLIADSAVEREIDLSMPETKTVVLRDLGIRNQLYQLKSATISNDTVTCILTGPRGEITHTVPVNREVWSKWPVVVKEAIDEETI